MNPCILCKKDRCPRVCYPKLDWQKHMKKKRKKGVRNESDDRNRRHEV
jgi:hypothetical protein